MKKRVIIIPPKWQTADCDCDKNDACHILLIPDSATEILGLYSADCVVSYGMSEKSTITLSSISDNEMVVSLQREIPTLDGEILDRQEIKMRRPSDISEESILAVVGALLLTGISPEKLSDFF